MKSYDTLRPYQSKPLAIFSFNKTAADNPEVRKTYAAQVRGADVGLASAAEVFLGMLVVPQSIGKDSEKGINDRRAFHKIDPCFGQSTAAILQLIDQIL